MALPCLPFVCVCVCLYNIWRVKVNKNMHCLWTRRHYNNTFNEFTHNDNTYNDNTYNDNADNDNAYNDNTYNGNTYNNNTYSDNTYNTEYELQYSYWQYS